MAVDVVIRVTTMLLPLQHHDIVATVRAKQNHDGANDDCDTRLVGGHRMAISGAEYDQFGDYDQAIRREYAWVEPAYRRGLLAVLRSFAERPRLFGIETLWHLEATAGRYLAASIEQLTTLAAT